MSDEKQSWIVLWLGNNEWTEYYETLEDLIADIKLDRRWNNYGRMGAVIVPNTPAYRLELVEKETYIDQLHQSAKKKKQP